MRCADKGQKSTNMKNNNSRALAKNRSVSQTKKAEERDILSFKDVEAPWLKSYPNIRQKVESLIKKEKENIYDLAKAQVEEFPHSVLLPYKFHVEELKLFQPQDQDIVSVRMKVYTYAGGAHGSTRYYSWNWSEKQKKFLNLSDVISTPEQISNLKAKTRAKLFSKQTQNNQYDKRHVHRGTSTMSDFQIWNLDQNNLIIVFQEYQVASYAAGSFEVTVSLKEL